MATNPINKGIISENFTGMGTVTQDVIHRRALELAILSGRFPARVTQAEFEQARRELTGGSDIDDSGQSVWSPRPGGDHTVCLSAGVRPSWDSQITVEPGHDVCQGQLGHRCAPERRRINAAPPFGETTAQKEHEVIAAPAKPIAPATHRMPRQAGTVCGAA